MSSVFKRGGKANRGGSYQISWVDHTGKRRSKSARTTDKATAERIVRKLEAEAALRREGVVDAVLDGISKESQRPIESHLADHEAKLRAANRTEKHITRTSQCIRRIAEHAGFETAADLTADGVNGFVGKLRDEGRSARTIQAHLAAIGAFSKWLTEHQKLPRDPLASVKKPNPNADRRRERRMLLPDEWLRLETATRAGPDRYGMTGRERWLLFQTAIQTGLRSAELRSLTRGRLYFDADQPYVMCKAGSTKNRKDAKQYILPELAVDLRAHITVKSPKAPVFNLPHEANLARMLRADVADAREQWLAEATDDPQEYAQREQSDFLAATNHNGEWLDFHSLRHSTGAWLAMAGEHPNVVQRVMRHQSITLTMDRYMHLFPGQEAAAVGRMRGLLESPPEALRATGTDNAPADTMTSAQRKAQQLGRETLRSVATGCDERTKPAVQRESSKPLRVADLGDDVRRDATGSESTPGRIRTCDLRIRSPLLYPTELRAREKRRLYTMTNRL